MTSAPLYPISDAAKLIGIGPKKLFTILRARNVLNRDNIPYQRYIAQGLMQVTHKTVDLPSGITKHYGQTVITSKGLDWLENELQKEAAQ